MQLKTLTDVIKFVNEYWGKLEKIKDVEFPPFLHLSHSSTTMLVLHKWFPNQVEWFDENADNFTSTGDYE